MPNASPVLLVTLMDPAAPEGGRELLYRLNARCLAELFGENLITHRLVKGRSGMIAALRGNLDGLSAGALVRLTAIVREGGIAQVFIDGSNLGAVATALRRNCPGVRIVTFFHNIEARFFLGSLRARKSVKALAVLAAHYLAERRAVRASDAIVTLSRRDSEGLRRLYGRGADHVSPMALADRPRPPLSRSPAASERTLLFVGGAFYANRIGIAWFAREVAPRLACRTVVVGRGMETLRGELAGISNVDVVGQVDDPGAAYAAAYCAIAPIFDGSGMKTKVAEALMFGKRIIGTREALSGYDEAVRALCWQADDADGFVRAVDAAMAADLPGFDPEARAMYEAGYSLEAAVRRMADVMGGSAFKLSAKNSADS